MVNDKFDVRDQITKKLWDSIKLPEEGEYVTFMLKPKGIHSQTGFPVYPPSMGISPVSRIKDGVAQKTVYFNTDILTNKEGKQFFKQGSVYFKSSSFSMIRFTRDQAESDINLYSFLYLHQDNESNKDAEYHIKPKKGYKFYRIMKNEDAKQEVDRRRRIKQAWDAVDKWDQDTLKMIGLEVLGREEKNMDVIREKLYTMAENNPERVINLTEDAKIKAKSDIKGWEKDGLIKVAGGYWVYSDNTTERIASVPPGRDPYESLANLLLSESGQAKYESLKTFAEAGKVTEAK